MTEEHRSKRWTGSLPSEKQQRQWIYKIWRADQVARLTIAAAIGLFLLVHWLGYF
jgi:hypothetical protein